MGRAMNMYSSNSFSAAHALCAGALLGGGRFWAAREVPKEKPRCHRLAGLGGVDQTRERILHAQQHFCNEYVLVANMNYYKFNVGDYSAATRHLSMLEHGAYRLLLDVYYTTEKPLPADLKAAARKAGARSKDEVAAVETVLGEFFHLTADGWVNNRCAVEIESYKTKAETNKVVGRLGGRPKKSTKTVAENNPDGFEKETQTVSENNPKHKPLTNNQEPIPETHTPLALDTPVCVDQSGDDFSGFDQHPAPTPITPTAAGAACLAMRAEGIADVNPSSPKLAALLAAGATNAELAAAARGAVDRGKGFAYALGTAQKQREEAAAMAAGLHTGPLPTRQPQAKSFAQQEREAGWSRWEEMTGRQHPDRLAAEGKKVSAVVIDIAAADQKNQTVRIEK